MKNDSHSRRMIDYYSLFAIASIYFSFSRNAECKILIYLRQVSKVSTVPPFLKNTDRLRLTMEMLDDGIYPAAYKRMAGNSR